MANDSKPISTLTDRPPPTDDSKYHGTGRLVIIRSGAKRRRGKPPLDKRIERDRIVAHVLDLLRAERLPKHVEAKHVEAAAEAFCCDERTVYRALREYRSYRVKVKFPAVEWREPWMIVTDPPFRGARLPADVKWGKPIPFRGARLPADVKWGKPIPFRFR